MMASVLRCSLVCTNLCSIFLSLLIFFGGVRWMRWLGFIVVGHVKSYDDQVSDALSQCQVQMSPNRAAKAVH